MFKFLPLFVFAMFLSVVAPGAYSGTITAKADVGGIIKPTGIVIVATGGSKTFSIVSSNPSEYVLVDVVVNGRSKGAISGYTFSKVGRSAKHTIYAKFKKIEQPVSPPVTSVEPAPTPLPIAPTPIAPTPIAPTPIAPTPIEPIAVAPTPIEPTPIEPIAVAPTPIAPTPIEPIAVAPTPIEPTPIAPTPIEPIAVAPTPIAPTPIQPIVVAPTPIEPTPVAPTPVVEPTPPVTNTNLPVSVAWSIPTKLTNGDPLLPADIVGYEVYYTSIDGTVSNIVAITSPTMTSAVVVVPTAGTYYFSIGTIAAQGEKSEMTNPIEVIVK